MVDRFELKKNPEFYKWFDRLYKIRDKWCTALSKDIFSAGVLSSQRSESTNSALGFEANKTTRLNRFYDLFNKTASN